MKYFSPSTLGFYIEDNKPDDAVKISEETWENLLDRAASEGKWITADEDGNPVLTDPPPLTQQEIKEAAENRKAKLMDAAIKAMAPLQNAVTLGIATDEEKASLTIWMTYSVQLSRVDTSNPAWPELPSV